MAQAETGILRIKVEGESVQPGKLPLRDLARLVERIQSGVERVARVMTGEPGGVPGRRPKRIEGVTQLLLVAVGPGSAVLSLELPSSPSDVHEEEQLVDISDDLGFRAVSRFVGGIHELEAGDVSGIPESWDNSVMEVAEDLAEFTRDRRLIVTLDARMPKTQPNSARIAGDSTAKFQIRHVPVRRPRRARGTLIAVDLETGRIDIKPGKEKRVECLFPQSLRAQVEGLVGQVVEASGEEDFDAATNKVGRLEVRTLEPAAEQLRLDDEFWRSPSAAELAAEQGVQPIRAIEELVSPEFSDEDIETLLTIIRDARSEE